MRRWLRATPALGWMALIWASSAQPWPQAGALLSDWLSYWPRWMLAVLAVLPPDKIVHGGIYAILAALWMGALAGRRALLVPWTIATAFGGMDELHQGFVPGRSRDGWDLLADATGAALACGVFWWWRRRTAKLAAKAVETPS